ncbi:433_t:CDS:1, partial [Racocetra fulgida]
FILLIILFSSLLALTITVDARINNKPSRFNKHINAKPAHFNQHANDKQRICTLTEISTNTITITKSCESVPTPIPTSYDKNYDHCDGCKTKKTITVTPTTTECATPTPSCCQSRGSPGWNDLLNTGDGNGLSAYLNTTSTPQECCMICIADKTCVSWSWSKVDITRNCFITGNGTGNACVGATVSPSSLGSEGGTVRCSNGSNC